VEGRGGNLEAFFLLANWVGCCCWLLLLLCVRACIRCVCFYIPFLHFLPRNRPRKISLLSICRMPLVVRLFIGSESFAMVRLWQYAYHEVLLNGFFVGVPARLSAQGASGPKWSPPGRRALRVTAELRLVTPTRSQKNFYRAATSRTSHPTADGHSQRSARCRSPRCAHSFFRGRPFSSSIRCAPSAPPPLR
jgi:hypothetical protein